MEESSMFRSGDPFVAIVDAARMPIIITDPKLPDNPVAYVNEAFCRLSGYRRSEIIGRNCRFLQGPGTAHAARSAIRDAIEARSPIDIDILNYRKDGTAFWNRLEMSPVFDGDGRLAYFFASQGEIRADQSRIDGLERDNAALAAEMTCRLRVQHQRDRELALTLRAGGFGTWSLEFETGSFIASDECKLLFGLAPGDRFAYQDMIEAIHEEDRACTIARMFSAVAEHGENGHDYRVRWPDGSLRWLSSRGQMFAECGDGPPCVAGVTFDVTVTKRTELKRRALAHLNDVLRDLDDSGDISHAAAKVLGETLGASRAGYGLVDPVLETITIERDWNAPGISSIAGTLPFRKHGSYVDDLKMGNTAVVEDSRLDDRTRGHSAVLEAIHARSFINMPLTEQGGFVALIFVNDGVARRWTRDDIAFVREIADRTRDAVERRRAERDLAALAASLELQVAERTDDLVAAQDALRQSQKMEAVGQLTGGIAHDFNNLLTAIGGALEMIELRMGQGRSTDIGRYLEAARSASRRAASLTHRLLAFSRRQTLDPRRMDVNALVVDIEDLVRRTVGPSVLVETRLADGLGATLVDSSQLENGLLNLCINARDAMPDGGRITIETRDCVIGAREAGEADVKPGSYVCLSVSDTGTGMSPAVVAKAFDPFFTTKPIGSGTGLGLSMVYGFARQSGGLVRIRSTPGAGTTITIYLPRSDGEVEREAPRADRVVNPAPRGNGTVLVVDDEEAVRSLILETLGELGYSAVGASDGPSALKVLMGLREVDLLVTDVGLPGMNGRQLSDAIRTVRPGLKVLFITGYAENAVLNHGHLDVGMHVMTKPFEMDALAARIGRIIGDYSPRS